MIWFKELKTDLSDLYHNNFSRAVDAFKPAFLTSFGEEHQTFRLKMFHNLDQLRLQLESETLHESKDVQIKRVQAVDASLVVTESSGIESINYSSENALSISVNETQMQMQEDKADLREALDAGLVVTESSGTKSNKQDTSSRAGTYITHAVDADIRLVNDQVPFTEEGRKITQDINKIPNPRDMASARTHRTPDACTPKPRNISRNVFNANHDACVTKFLNEVNSGERKPSHKTTTFYKPVEKTSSTKKSLGQIPIGHMFSTTKSSAV
nr:hypothetical protein [Tanacetum cinerariifolium]